MIKLIQKGKIILVSNNIAHGMIERGEAKLYKAPRNKMMKSDGKKKRRYNTK